MNRLSALQSRPNAKAHVALIWYATKLFVPQSNRMSIIGEGIAIQ